MNTQPPATPPIAATPVRHEVSGLDLALVLTRHLKLVLGMPLLIGAVALGATYLITPSFTSSTQIMLPQQQQSGAAALLGSLGGLAGAAAGGALKNPADQWIGFLKSRTVQDAMIARFNLRERYEAEYQFQARNTLGGKTVVTAGKDGMINIDVTDHDPKAAADMANAYVDELQKLSKTLAVTEAAQRRVFFEGQLSDAKDKLVKAETALRASGVNQSVLKTNPEAAIAGVAQLKAQITATEVRISVLRGQMAPGNPELQLTLAELGSLRSQLAKAERADVGDDTNKAGAEYVARFREFKYYETLFELMARQYELARSDEAKDGALIQVVDTAPVPEWKSSPKRGMITVLSFMMALTFSVIYVLLREAARNAAQRDPLVAEKLARLKHAIQPWRRGSART